MSDSQRPEKRRPRRIRRELTAAETERLKAAREQAKAELPDLLDRADKRQAALREETVSGQLRQAIAASQIQYVDLAERAGISPRELADFMTGDAELNSASFDRLAELLGSRLVAESA